MPDPQATADINALRKADIYKKNKDTIDNRPAGIGWGPRGMRRGGWTGYGVYWGKGRSEDGEDKVDSTLKAEGKM